MSYIVEIVFKGNVAPRLFGVFRSPEQARIWAMGMILSTKGTMDYRVKSMELVA